MNSKKNSCFVASPDSQDRYYPLFLANGDDCIVVDYSSSNYVSLNGHSHFEQHQGTACGWYKASYRTMDQWEQPAFATGVQVVFNGAPAEPEFYEQTFDPRTATVSSILSFARDVKIKVEGFLTDDGIWCEKVTALSAPKEVQVAIGFRVCEARSCMQAAALQFKNEFSAQVHESEITFNYEVGVFSGSGVVICEKPFDYNDTSIFKSTTGYYRDVETGFTVKRYTICVDNSEKGRIEELRKKIENDTENNIEKEHQKLWGEYFGTSEICIPDEKLQAEYELSRYIIKAAQHRKNGFINCGFFPNHWGGGTCCSYDSDMALSGFATSGNIAELKKYVESYELVAPQGYEILGSRGIKGTSFLGWVNVKGEYLNHMDPFDSLVRSKPIFSAYVFISAKQLWKKDKSLITDSMKKILEDTCLFFKTHMIIDKGDKAYLIPVKAGNEAGFNVSLDTFTQMIYAVSFEFAGEVLENEEYTVISKKLFEGLKDNMDENGILWPFENANYYSGTSQYYTYIYTYPNAFAGIDNVHAALNAGKTKWGIDFDQTSETYRHWSWNESHAVLCFTRAGEHKNAMEHVLKLANYISATGALPEKIRIDGEPVNYWYTTAHGFVVWAMNDALALNRQRDEILVAYGISDPWKDFSCRDISLNDMIFISYEISGGKLVSLELKNRGSEEKTLKLFFNEEFDKGACPDTVTVKPGDSYKFDA